MQFAKKIAYRHRALFCYVVIVWGVGTVLATILFGYWSSWNRAKNDYNEAKQMLQKRTLWFSVKHPKAMTTMKYCGPPHTIGLEQEGESRKSDRLELVIVIIRHGDRGPMQTFHNLSSINCGVNTTTHQDLDKFLQDIRAKEAGRSSQDPFRHLSPANEDSACKVGHLTLKGTLQLLRLGQKLRETYIGKLKLLPKKWTREHVAVTSTMVERTYQSAVAFLYGFLPGFQLPQLNFKVGFGTTLCYSQPYCQCDLVDKVLKRRIESDKSKHVMSHPAVQELSRKLDSFLSAHRSSPQTEDKPDGIFDKFLMYVCHQVPLPCIDGVGCATMDQLNSITAFLEWRGRQLAKSYHVRLSARLSMHGFLVDILKRLTDTKTAKKKHRIVLYSAHDNTLMPLLVALGVLDGARPPYASRLVWELYSSPPKGKATDKLRRYHLRVVYNGKDITKRMMFCAKEMSQPSKLMRLCPLENFREFVQDDLLMEMNVTSYKRACVAPLSSQRLSLQHLI